MESPFLQSLDNLKDFPSHEELKKDENNDPWEW